MAQTYGYTCDVCAKFESAPKPTINDSAIPKLPKGWIVVAPYTTSDLPPLRIEVCGNRCMMQLGRDRLEALDGVRCTITTKRTYGPNEVDG